VSRSDRGNRRREIRDFAALVLQPALASADRMHAIMPNVGALSRGTEVTKSINDGGVSTFPIVRGIRCKYVTES
jgi:hypothetical protein